MLSTLHILSYLSFITTCKVHTVITCPPFYILRLPAPHFTDVETVQGHITSQCGNQYHTPGSLAIRLSKLSHNLTLILV